MLHETLHKEGVYGSVLEGGGGGGEERWGRDKKSTLNYDILNLPADRFNRITNQLYPC